jgi:hypothetical protein
MSYPVSTTNIHRVADLPVPPTVVPPLENAQRTAPPAPVATDATIATEPAAEPAAAQPSTSAARDTTRLAPKKARQKPTAAPQASAASATAATSAATTDPHSPAHRRPRTGAGARFNPDNIGLYRAVNAGVIITALAAIAISWQGLTAVGGWFLPDYAAWLLPIAIDVAIVVFTLATLARRARGESIVLLLIGAYGLTGVSAAANASHVFLEPNPALGHVEVIIAATLAGLAPLLILLTTEVLGTLITKPPRVDGSSKKLAETQAELKAVRRELAKATRVAGGKARDES